MDDMMLVSIWYNVTIGFTFVIVLKSIRLNSIGTNIVSFYNDCLIQSEQFAINKLIKTLYINKTNNG